MSRPARAEMRVAPAPTELLHCVPAKEDDHQQRGRESRGDLCKGPVATREIYCLLTLSGGNCLVSFVFGAAYQFSAHSFVFREVRELVVT